MATAATAPAEAGAGTSEAPPPDDSGGEVDAVIETKSLIVHSIESA